MKKWKANKNEGNEYDMHWRRFILAIKTKNAQFVSEVRQAIVAFATFNAIILCAD